MSRDGRKMSPRSCNHKPTLPQRYSQVYISQVDQIAYLVEPLAVWLKQTQIFSGENHPHLNESLNVIV